MSNLLLFEGEGSSHRSSSPTKKFRPRIWLQSLQSFESVQLRPHGNLRETGCPQCILRRVREFGAPWWQLPRGQLTSVCCGIAARSCLP
jgi:hypothetical protein